MEIVARQLLRAIRGPRSQIAFARRLGYASNPIAEWEGGRRFPTAAELLRACRAAKIDVDAAFAAFHPGAAPALGAGDDAGVATWLDALRGSTPISEVAERVGGSRSAVSRWLSGRTRPRAPELLRLIDALTGRVADWVAALVDIARVPALSERHRHLEASRRLAFDAPWTEAVLRLLETDGYRARRRHPPGWVARRLGLTLEEEADCLSRLVDAGVVRRSRGRYVIDGQLTVDTRAAPSAVHHLKSHWLEVARTRMREPRDGDYFGYNVFSVSRADLLRIRELHVAYFRAVRSIVAASEPAEVVGLMNVHLMDFDDP
jgi:transcriptional regulator with XRE-family HTH domain